jgi:hypothetical protein
VRFVVSVVFTPTRGVIHPSFSLRGRWERIAKSGEQAPSPSLASLLNSSCETHSCTSLMHGLRQSRRGCDFLSSHLLTDTWLDYTIPQPPRICPFGPQWNSPKLIREPCLFPLAPWLWPPSSRTLVTEFSGLRRYRFFDAILAVSLHALPSRQLPYSADLGDRSCLSTHKPFCWITDSIGGYSRGTANRRGRLLLLPLRGVQCAPQLREDV